MAKGTLLESAEQRRQDLVQANDRLTEAELLGRTLEDLRRDVVELEARRDKLAALGADHITIPQRSIDPRYRVEIQWEDIRSKLTGAELAAEVEASIEPLREEVTRTESRIAELLK